MKSLKENLSRIFGKNQTEQSNADVEPIAELQSEQNKATFLPNEEQPSFEQVEGTPFTLLITSKNVRVLCGNAIIDAHEFKNTDEAKKYIYKTPYTLIYNFICFAIQNLQKQVK